MSHVQSVDFIYKQLFVFSFPFFSHLSYTICTVYLHLPQISQKINLFLCKNQLTRYMYFQIKMSLKPFVPFGTRVIRYFGVKSVLETELMISSETKKPCKLIPQQPHKWHVFINQMLQPSKIFNGKANPLKSTNKSSSQQHEHASVTSLLRTFFLMHSNSSSNCACINFQSCRMKQLH